MQDLQKTHDLLENMLKEVAENTENINNQQTNILMQVQGQKQTKIRLTVLV